MNLLERIRASLAASEDTRQTDPERGLRLAAAVLLLEIEHADHQVEPAEQAEIERQLREFFALDADEAAELIAAAEAEAGQAVSLHAFLREVNAGLDAPSKRRVLEMLWRVAYADRHIDAQEEHLLRQIADLLYLPHEEFIKAKLAVLDS